MDVVIAGAGIGGLSLAASLSQNGTRVTVLERASLLGPVGAGITVQPNAMLALRTVGLDRAVADGGCIVTTSALLDARGRTLAEMPLEDIGRTVGAPTVCIHRARLHRVLQEAAHSADLRLDCEVVEVSGLEGGMARPALTTRNGMRCEGDLVIGADGLHSRVRAALEGEKPPTYAGYTSWRGVCANQGRVPPGRVTESWGRGERFGIVPIGHDEVYWFCTADAPPGGRDEGGARAALLERFGRWHAPVADLIEATPEDKILRTDITDRAVIRRWSRGRVALLGDAAHPMTPNLGQGGCQAIEDAIVLARALASERSIEEALARYESTRIDRANEVVDRARSLGNVAQWSSPFGCFVRDWLMRLTPTSMARRSLERALRFEPDTSR
jgi:2-polyprenyl-6-methoxyphenol hydroxylase-like FAD-dependent oxidoreductase